MSQILRTPEERFAAILDFPYAPHYIDTLRGYEGLRMHYVDAGDARQMIDPLDVVQADRGVAVAVSEIGSGYDVRAGCNSGMKRLVTAGGDSGLHELDRGGDQGAGPRQPDPA